MRNERDPQLEDQMRNPRRKDMQLPAPTTAFRRRAWLEFQRALDPLAQPKPLRLERH